MTNDEAAALRAAAEAMLRERGAIAADPDRTRDYAETTPIADASLAFYRAASPSAVLALLAEREALRAALREIIEHCDNSGYGNPIVDNRTVDRCEDTARAALFGSAAP